VNNVGFEYLDLSLNLVYFNPNNFKVDLKKVDCDVYIDNRYLGKYALDTLMHIPKKQNFELPSQMRVSMGGVFKNAFSLFLNKEVLIKVKGKTKIGKGSIFFDVPFTYETKQTISL
jgi:LEA14-like dessication related protein